MAKSIEKSPQKRSPSPAASKGTRNDECPTCSSCRPPRKKTNTPLRGLTYSEKGKKHVRPNEEKEIPASSARYTPPHEERTILSKKHGLLTTKRRGREKTLSSLHKTACDRLRLCYRSKRQGRTRYRASEGKEVVIQGKGEAQEPVCTPSPKGHLGLVWTSICHGKKKKGGLLLPSKKGDSGAEKIGPQKSRRSIRVRGSHCAAVGGAIP